MAGTEGRIFDAAGETIEAFISRQPQARRWLDETAVIAACQASTAECRLFVDAARIFHAVQDYMMELN